MVKPGCTGMAAAHLQPGLFGLERHYRAVSYATGVRKVVEFGSAPVKLDATMIDAIKERLNNGYVTKPVRPMYGQVVHQDGPHASADPELTSPPASGSCEDGNY